jgi:hypothetical protein
MRESPDALAFEMPSSTDAVGVADAERKLLAMPSRYLDKCKEQNALRQQCKDVGESRDRIARLTVRNLLEVVDVCDVILNELASASDGAAAETVAELSSNTVGKVCRMVVQLLEQLEVVPVDVMGKTYESVTFNDQPIPDPFEVVELNTDAAVMTSPVVRVLSPTWISTSGGMVKVVRRGRVCI